MIESPTKPVAASPDDRPIVIGRVDQPDYYVLAHQWMNQGYTHQAYLSLTMAAISLGVRTREAATPEDYWDLNLEAIDKAWGEKQKQLLEQSKPAPNPVQIMRVAAHSIFIDAVIAHENDRPLVASTLLHLVAHMVDFEGDWSGTVEQDWERNFDGVHQSWVEEWSKLQ